MKIKLHIVTTPETETVMQDVQAVLKAKEPALHFSPARPAPGLNDCLEWYATADLDKEKAAALRQWLDNDWDGDEQDCWAYGFNTKPFDSHVYYIHMETN